MEESVDDAARLVREYERHTTGTENWHRYWLGVLYTDGIKFVAETCAAWWLLDVVASYQPTIRQRMLRDGLRAFQVWRLHWLGDFTPDEVKRCAPPKSGGWIVDAWTDTPGYPGGEDGPASVLLARQDIGYSTFPAALSPFEFWVEGDVLLLKGEH